MNQTLLAVGMAATVLVTIGLAMYSSRLARTTDGRQLISPELLHVSFVDLDAGGKEVRAPVTVRGVDPVAYEVHRTVRVLRGRLPENSWEALAGCAAHVKLGSLYYRFATGDSGDYSVAEKEEFVRKAVERYGRAVELEDIPEAHKGLARIAARLGEWSPPEKAIPRGFLRLYADCVGPASEGAVLGGR